MFFNKDKSHWLCPAKNLIDIVGSATELMGDVWTIRHETSRLHILPKTVHRRQSSAQSQGVDAEPVSVQEHLSAYIKRIRAALELGDKCLMVTREEAETFLEAK